MPRADYGSLGRLVIAWNDLEFSIRQILIALAHEPITAVMLSADYNAVTMFNTVRMLVHERDQSHNRINEALRVEMKKRDALIRLYDLAGAHVNNLIDCADRLRIYRNVYVHGIQSAHKGGFFIGSITARPKFAFHMHKLPVAEVTKITRQVRALSKYAAEILKAVESNQSENRLSSPPKWPQIHPLPERLERRLTYLQDMVPQFLASDP